MKDSASLNMHHVSLYFTKFEIEKLLFFCNNTTYEEKQFVIFHNTKFPRPLEGGGTTAFPGLNLNWGGIIWKPPPIYSKFFVNYD